MRVVKEGDQYQPDHGEVVNIRVDDKDYYVVVVIDGIHISCYGCPLAYKHCQDWLHISVGHMMISLEESVE